VSVREHHWRGLAGHRKVVTHTVPAGYLHHLTGYDWRPEPPAGSGRGFHGVTGRPMCDHAAGSGLPAVTAAEELRFEIVDGATVSVAVVVSRTEAELMSACCAVTA
jgi:hypothetical protein